MIATLMISPSGAPVGQVSLGEVEACDVIRCSCTSVDR
jgi:hypothetical protein